ncbi:hypothetical protein SAMN05421847_1578 [Halpernia humi]|uniref:Histidine kinase/HSP90-like ATPase domain-containing protein n=1 Tax=Halpernia humi TaxID=493375 RepID=A0A1H5XW78_9FLAO|nr:hypothetical protein [Halpernia humi]SEG15951.1 hypothetical protein SAMN05421847_1578 [Halpernia humi]
MIVPVENIVENVDLTADDALLPMMECIVNSIISLQQSTINNDDKEIQIKIIRGRSPHQPNFDNVNTIDSIIITDNGIGFNEKNYKSFETPFSKINKQFGCKGIGRFTVLAAFESLKIKSTYYEKEEWHYREFEFNSEDELKPIDLKISEIKTNKTTVELRNCFNEIIKEKSALSLLQISEKIMEHCLIYYLNDNLPSIALYDTDNEQVEYINELFKKVSKEKERTFFVKDKQFKIYITKTLKEGNRKNNYVYYCANSRVVGNPKNIKSFNTLFNYPISKNGNLYFLNVYVVSEFLNKKAFSTRNGFNIPKENENSLFDNSKLVTFQDIENKLTEVLEDEYDQFVKDAKIKSQQQIETYIINNAPRYRSFLKNPSILNSVPPNLSEDKLEEHLYKISYSARKKVENHIEKFINEKQISEESIERIKDDIREKTAYDIDSLADYMTRRKAIIQLFEKFLDADEEGKYKLEEDVHNLIFPMGLTNNETSYENHNLWLLDERFINYKFIASDKPITSYSQKRSSKEADLLLVENPEMFDNPISFGNRSSGEVNSMVIFEFKRPGEIAHQKNKGDYRWQFSDLVEPYFDEFLYKQDKKNYRGNHIVITENTPKFGFIVLDVIPPLLAKYNEGKGWKKTPFGTYYKIQSELNMHIEVMTFRKLLDIAQNRHSTFFDKLFG